MNVCFYCVKFGWSSCTVVDDSYRGGNRGGYRGGPAGYGGGGRESNADRLVDQLQELVGVLAYVLNSFHISLVIITDYICQ